MSRKAAKRGDDVTAVDTHIVLIPSSGGAVPTPLPHDFAGALDGGLSATVLIDGHPAAVVGSTATNQPAHVAKGGSFQTPPHNRGTVTAGSSSVRIDEKAAARDGDPAETCNDPSDLATGRVVVASSTVVMG